MFYLVSLWIASLTIQFKLLSSNALFQIFFSLNPSRILFLYIFFLLYRYIRKDKTTILPINKLEKNMIYFSVLCVFSYCIHLPDSGLPAFRHLNSLFSLIFYPMLAYFFAKGAAFDKTNVLKVCRCFLLMGVYLGFTALFERYKIYNLIWPSYIIDPSVGYQFGRSRGPFVEAAAMGRFMGLTILIMMVMTTFCTGAKKFILYNLIAISLAGLYFTNTRGPWLGFSFSLIVFLIGKSSVRHVVYFVIFLVIFVGLTGITSKIDFFGTTVFSTRKDTADNRLVVWNTGINMGLSNPLFGVGYGNFNSEWENYFVNLDGINFDSFDGNHSTPFGIFAELGFLGLYFYLSIFTQQSFIAYKIYHRTKHKEPFFREFILLISALNVCYLFSSLFVDTRWDPSINTALFLFFGILSSLDKKLNNE